MAPKAPSRNPRVLLVNDDGPPSSTSPHILPLYTALRALGWDVTVVIPSGQRSWGSMAFSIKGNLPVWYYYPIQNNNDGSHPDTASSWSSSRRPIDHAKGEIAEWIALDGSPTTATNVGLFNTDTLFDAQSHPVTRRVSSTASTATAAGASSSNTPAFLNPPFQSWADLVVSGPNFGRNTGSAFALSSGTLGAALSGALSGVKSIAVSYGHFAGDSGPKRPTFPSTATPGNSTDAAAAAAEVKTDPNAGHVVQSPPAPEHVEQLATNLTVKIIRRLWDQWEEGVQCYSVNVPLSWTLEDPKIYWTRVWENSYPKLFRPVPLEEVRENPSRTVVSQDKDNTSRPQPALHLTFAPPMGTMLAPSQLPEGTDIWALMNGWVSVVRLNANYSHAFPSGNLERAWSDASNELGPTSTGTRPAGPGTRWML
ncbi:hypothetical protein OC846_003787 [Tilletia horrida]|uniref:Survival protein SurE-like phosphatase/nucleotidase domain-containing protein n=1 Tax=Tilletia horrida TaxID=155126 RepID=A0AAN6GPW5_9BASI|nr:hypothetical protein OC846_003787 [Tilletia horrida]KAK0564830.1 hypothetical protein OC861_004069 [Tilletia horrida]